MTTKHDILRGPLTLAEAQAEVRLAFLRGSVGQIVTGAIWLASAALGTWGSRQLGILALFLGGMFIFPLTQLVLRLIGQPGSLARDNPLGRFPLQMVVAMTAMYPLVYVAALHNINWFYPAFMLVVAAHYVSFILLYGMWQYGALAAFLFAGAAAAALFWPNAFSAGGWLSGIALVLFGLMISRKTA
jgi:hypothetical protein